MSDMTEPVIHVQYNPDSDGLAIVEPTLTWWHHPIHGNGWTLWYLDEPGSPTAGVEEYFIPGDLTDVDAAVESARQVVAGLVEPGA